MIVCVCVINDAKMSSPATLCFVETYVVTVYTMDRNEMVVGLSILTSYNVLLISFMAY